MEWKCDFDHHTINRLIYRWEDKFLNSLRASFAILGVNCEPYIVQLPASAQEVKTTRRFARITFSIWVHISKQIYHWFYYTPTEGGFMLLFMRINAPAFVFRGQSESQDIRTSSCLLDDKRWWVKRLSNVIRRQSIECNPNNYSKPFCPE